MSEYTTMTTAFVQFRRKREGRTNYRKRLSLLKSKKPRLVVRKTNKHIIAQIVSYEPRGDKVLVGLNSKELEKEGWQFSTKNIPACYLAGMLLSKKIRERHPELKQELILDLGLQTSIKGSRIYALVKGMRDNGVQVLCSDEVFPAPERISGKHITTHYEARNGSKDHMYSTYKDVQSFEQTFTKLAQKFKTK